MTMRDSLRRASAHSFLGHGKAAHSQVSREADEVPYWARATEELLRELGTSVHTGLTEDDAAARLLAYGPNAVSAQHAPSRLRILLRQLRSPLLLLLVFAAVASLGTGELVDATVVLSVLVVSVTVGYVREHSAADAAAALQARIRAQTRVYRDGRLRTLPTEQLVPGDVIQLAAGSLIPADCIVLEATDLHVDQAVLTGESYPVGKRAGVVAHAAPMVQRTNCVFLGTNVRSGTATCLVMHTGQATHFGALAGRLRLRPPETDFDRGTKHFSYMLSSAMALMVLGVFAVHVLQGRPPIETLLFAIALAVGLSPELLPVILNVNLSRGAEGLAAQGVLVRRLTALENLGSMDVLCTDKTGTLTEGVVAVQDGYTPSGAPSREVRALGILNAALSTGVDNPLDQALVRAGAQDAPETAEKLAEIPFDFVRKRASVVFQTDSGARLVTKGAFHEVLAACDHADGALLTREDRERLGEMVRAWGGEGTRVLGIATRHVDVRPKYTAEDEHGLNFEGFLTFSDRTKADARDAIARLGTRGVQVKVITGDAAPVAQHVAREVGLAAEHMLTGKQLDELHDEALWKLAEETTVFAEVDPNQKERILLALKKLGHVVGFLGDGVNDAPAMHAADVSLSVDQAVDVARETADLVLLERSLDVIHDGIGLGRTTLANTLKYILTTTSANLGNMLSMAAASLFLPFLPLLSGQILLNNFLSDIPAVGIATDDVDPEMVARPERWNMHFIQRFMTEFGALSSVFDLLTFGLLGWVFRASVPTFRTAWFVESLLTELVIALVVRTRRPLLRSTPGKLLLRATLGLTVVALAIPYLPFADYLGFVPLPLPVLAAVVTVTFCYVLATERLKGWFYRQAVDRVLL